jgi:hypothetical protein
MSDYYEVAAMPRSAFLPTREQLFALFQDLLESSIVILPCLILQLPAAFDAQSYNASMTLDYLDYQPGRSQPVRQRMAHSSDPELLYYCEDEMTLRTALGEAPYGARDLCFRFESLDFRNQEIAALYQSSFQRPLDREELSSDRVRVHLFTFAEPQLIPINYSGQDEYSDEGSLAEMKDTQEGLEGYFDDAWGHWHHRSTRCCLRIGWDNGGYLNASIRSVLSRHFGTDFLEGYSGGTADQ